MLHQDVKDDLPHNLSDKHKINSATFDQNGLCVKQDIFCVGKNEKRGKTVSHKYNFLNIFFQNYLRAFIFLKILYYSEMVVHL